MSEAAAVLRIIAFLVVGGVLLLIECVVPGFSVPGTLGLAMLGIACYLAFTSLHLVAGVITVLTSGGLILFLARYFPRTRLGRRLQLRVMQGKAAGYHAGSVTVRVGDTGEALTTLRPSGMARIGGRRVDVVTEGAFVPEGAAVVVVQVEGMRVVVRAQTGG